MRHWVANLDPNPSPSPSPSPSLNIYPNPSPNPNLERERTVADYFKERYPQHPLQYPHLPCVDVKKKGSGKVRTEN